MSIKECGTWLTKLKFVGLVYDPFLDTLSAKTRNGATLKLKVGTVGYFSESTMERKTIPTVHEDSHTEWNKTNKQLFD
jgi:hypothetical protein